MYVDNEIYAIWQVHSFICFTVIGFQRKNAQNTDIGRTGGPSIPGLDLFGDGNYTKYNLNPTYSVNIPFILNAT